MSPWLTKYPAKAKPQSPPDTVSRATATIGWSHVTNPVLTSRAAGPTVPVSGIETIHSGEVKFKDKTGTRRSRTANR